MAERWAMNQGSDPSEAPIWQVAEEPDPDLTDWLKGLEYVGIDIAINLVVDWGAGEGWGEESSVSIEEINRRMCLATQQYPGRLYTFVGVNPYRHNAVEIVERGVREWGARGLKLYPPMGFYPNDRVCYRLYEKCAELGVPVTLHMGYGWIGRLKYADPVYLDEPAKDFPELDFIIAHAGTVIGFPWEQAVVVAAGNPNIHLEFSAPSSVLKGGRQGETGRYTDHIPMFLDRLEVMRNRIAGGCGRMLFGTDYPTFPAEMFKRWADFFRNLPAIAARYGYDFSQEEADQICYKNAARIIGLDIGKGQQERKQ